MCWLNPKSCWQSTFPVYHTLNFSKVDDRIDESSQLFGRWWPLINRIINLHPTWFVGAEPELPQYDKPLVTSKQSHFGGTGINDQHEYSNSDEDEDRLDMEFTIYCHFYAHSVWTTIYNSTVTVCCIMLIWVFILKSWAGLAHWYLPFLIDERFPVPVTKDDSGNHCMQATKQWQIQDFP